MILAGENGAVSFQRHQHPRNCSGSNDLAEGEMEAGQSRVRESPDVEMEGGGRSEDGGGQGIGDVDLRFPIRQPLQRRPVVVVGHALTSKKVESFLQPKLERVARLKGILFVPVDHDKPLSDQGPFDIVLHKLLGKEWRQILEVVEIWRRKLKEEDMKRRRCSCSGVRAAATRELSSRCSCTSKAEKLD